MEEGAGVLNGGVREVLPGGGGEPEGDVLGVDLEGLGVD